MDTNRLLETIAVRRERRDQCINDVTELASQLKEAKAELALREIQLNDAIACIREPGLFDELEDDAE